MFDLSLLRVPTFAGGSIAAFAMNGSLYAVLLWLVIYLQDVLGYSAEQAGLRLAVISGAQLITATIAGRLSERIPARWLIGPGLVLVGVGLIVMAGLTGGSDWTHLIPGFIVAGLGGGMVNPPLASTAIGVVPPQKAGMASGVNSTFRQIGLAASIAVLGSIGAGVMGFVLPPTNETQLIAVIAFGGFFLLLGGLMCFWALRRRTRISEKGLTSEYMFSGPRFLAWEDVEKLSFASGQEFWVKGAKRKAMLHVWYVGLRDAVPLLREHLPEAVRKKYASTIDTLAARVGAE